MPIQFRCMHCGQMLSISSRRIGSTVNCPACTEPIRVPGEVDPTAQISPPVRETKPSSASSTSPVKAAAVSAPVQATNLWADEEEDEDAPRGLRESRIANDGLDMTPMVDVTFQLLIFFMITASFVTQKSLQTSPPEPKEDAGEVKMQVEENDEGPVVVSIGEDGSLLIDDFPVEASGVLETLTAKMSAESKSSLLIEADYKAPHGMVILVMDSGISAGMQSIRKTTRKDE